MKEYSETDIKTLSAREHVRSRPGICFENCFRQQHLNDLPFEILCHAFDEYFDKNCDKISIEVSSFDFTVVYDAGISLEQDSDGITRAENIMTRIYACRNEKKHLAVGEQYCRIGLAAINYASEKSTLTTISGSLKGIFHFEKGELLSKEISTTEEKDMTCIYLKPDATLFPGLSLAIDGVRENAKAIEKELAGLTIQITEKK